MNLEKLKEVAAFISTEEAQQALGMLLKDLNYNGEGNEYMFVLTKLLTNYQDNKKSMQRGIRLTQALQKRQELEDEIVEILNE